MCIWAGYSNKLDHVYGSSFVLVTVSWLLFLLATVSGAWELGKGIPAQVQRVFNVGEYMPRVLVPPSMLGTACYC